MKNAKKLSLQLPKIDLDKIELIPDTGEFRHVIFENRAGVTRFKLPESISTDILNCLPEKFRPFVFCINFSKIQSAVPHYHTYDESVINHYIDTDDYETTFYNRISDSDNTEIDFPEEGLIKVVDIACVVPTEKFVAKSGDVYVLNSKAIHSVSQIGNLDFGYNKYRPIREEKRFTIQIWTKCPFHLAYHILS